MKPRIKIRRIGGKVFWRCEGIPDGDDAQWGSVAETGETPAIAYRRWLQYWDIPF